MKLWCGAGTGPQQAELETVGERGQAVNGGEGVEPWRERERGEGSTMLAAFQGEMNV